MSHERDQLARLIYAALSALLVVAAFFDTMSLFNFVLEHSRGGSLVIAALAGATALVSADVIINDMAPPHISFAAVYIKRPIIYTTTSFLYLVPLFTATRLGVSVTMTAALLCICMAGIGLTIAARSVVERHRHRFAGRHPPCDT